MHPNDGTPKNKEVQDQKNAVVAETSSSETDDNTPSLAIGEAGKKDLTEEPIPPLEPHKVLVIDDELAGLTGQHLSDSAPEFMNALSDITSPTCESVWKTVAERDGQPKFETANPDQIATYFESDAFVKQLRHYKHELQSTLPDPDQIDRYFTLEQKVSELRSLLISAYAEPDFTIDFETSRPTDPTKLLEYNLVILDLVLADSTSAVDELVDFLKLLANRKENLPCLIVLSSHNEMNQNRPLFSTEANISAAGLLLLEKKNVLHPNFGAAGLRLCYEQLSLQHDVAQNFRLFVRAWIDGLDKAKRLASETLWNLDAAMMQEIHLSASSDGDPYDTHLADLVSREYLWHVEKHATVTKSIEALDKSLDAHIENDNSNNVAIERFLTPFASATPGRNLVSHYNWTGFRAAGPLSQHTKDELRQQFNRLIPFGAVLAPETPADGMQCWVHITQQCDLNDTVRQSSSNSPKKSSISAMFAIATAMTVSDYQLPDHHTQDIVAKGLTLGDNEYDIKLVSGQVISLPLDQIIDLVLKENRQVIGRLRHDIATQFLSATANHMTRAAQLKATRIIVRPAQLYIWGGGLNENNPIPFTLGESETPKIINITTQNKNHYITDNTGMWVALWITTQANLGSGKQTVDTSVAYSKIRSGFKDKKTLISNIKLDVKELLFNSIEQFFRGNNKMPDQPKLFIFMEP